MTEIKVIVSRAGARATTDGYLTSGMVGVQAVFEYDSKVWAGLKKTAVFSADGVTRDVLNADGAVTVPAEVLKKPNVMLYVGAYGTNAEGDLVIPTVMVPVAVIVPGADPSGDEGTNADPAIWEQLQAQINALAPGGSIKISDDGKGNVTINTGGE